MLHLLVLLIVIVSTQSPSKCDILLFDFYRSLGLSSSAVPIPVVAVSLLPNNVGADLVFDFENIARLYQSSINNSLIDAPQPTIEYVSFSYPWCVTSIQVLCGGELRQNLPKTWQCSTPDYDLGGVSLNGGRLLITRNANCQSMRLRLLGPLTLSSIPSFDAVYTYSTLGLPANFTQNITPEEAIRDYQHSRCTVLPGNTTTLPLGQSQYVCFDRDLRCLGPPRPSDINSTRPFTPFPTFACRGNVTPGGPPVIVWYINGYDIAFGVKSVQYELRFCPRYDASCMNIAPQAHGIISGTRQQFISNFSSFDSVLVLTYNGVTAHYDAAYLRSLDQFIRDVPCVCGLSLLCTPSGLALNGIGSLKFLNPSNILPVAAAGPNTSILLNTPSVLLNASDSFDRDRAPNLLTYYWKVYNATPSPVTIECVECVVTRVTGQFIKGYYTFIVYVSDGEDVTFDVVSFYVDENVIRVVLPPDFDAQFDLVTRCPSSYDAQGYPVLGENFTAIVLNGSLTYNENPNFPLFYEWTQTTGNEINTTLPIVCDPATVDFLNFEAFWRRNESIAYFIPSTLGIYCFRLTVTDGTGQRTAYEEMCVSVEDDFSRSNATDRNYTDYPDAPGYNHSDPVVPNITFEPANRTPINDITQSPSATLPPPPPTPVSPIIAFIAIFFPQLPPPTLIAQLLLLFVTIACLLVFILLTGYCIAYMPVDDFDDFIEQQVLQQQQQ